MTSEHALAHLRHRDDTARGDARRLEALVHGEAEHEWETARETREQRHRRLVFEAQVLAHLLLQGGAITALRRLDRGLDAVADLGARVAVDSALERALVVVDEEPGRHDRRRLALLPLQELQGTGDRIGSAGAELALVVARGEAGAEVDLRRK